MDRREGDLHMHARRSWPGRTSGVVVCGSVPMQTGPTSWNASWAATSTLTEGEGSPTRTSLAGRRVIVTGAAGFIGTHLTRALAADKAWVTALDERAIDPPTATVLRARRVDLLTADLTSLFAGVDAVFHLAGRPGVRQSWGPGFEAYVRCNLLGTERVVEACVEAGVRRLVVASSSSVYGQGLGRPSREADPTQPVSPYGVSKLAAEQLCLAHALRPDVTTSVAVLRYFTVYGPGQRPDMLISRLLRAARTGQPAPVFGTGQQSRDFTYVEDVVEATIAAATLDCRAEVVNVAGGAPATVTEVIHLVSELTGRQVPIDHKPEQDGDVASTCADLTRARIRLGYVPQVSLREGLARHLAWESTQPLDPLGPAGEPSDAPTVEGR
ncbi:MAG TPA: NAD-dependent epimerase/dehydratase family protein [Kineosporiaceae bacterium]